MSDHWDAIAAAADRLNEQDRHSLPATRAQRYYRANSTRLQAQARDRYRLRKREDARIIAARPKDG